MNVNFGLFPPITTGKGGRDRKLAYTQRAKRDLGEWLEGRGQDSGVGGQEEKYVASVG
jgi:hypothetical protein